ncbi:hypothetical protein P0G10_16950 [Eubacteriales bacterium DFI.9.88]|nr:hypothetical protein [Eubacteriales bacterium DFI.9.88]
MKLLDGISFVLSILAIVLSLIVIILLLKRKIENQQKKKALRKRREQIKTQLTVIPYGGGWEDVYLIVDGETWYFVISSMMGDSFNALLEALYYLDPDNIDKKSFDGLNADTFYLASKGVDEPQEKVSDLEEFRKIHGSPYYYIEEPYRIRFEWCSEPETDQWTIEKEQSLEKTFDIHIKIKRSADDGKIIEFTKPYKEFCYAVAKGCTEALKKHGMLGYHQAIYYDDLNLRHLLRIKTIALDRLDALEITHSKEKGEGERTSLEAELELLLEDM